MDFQKKYALPRLQDEFILAQWERGFKSVKLFFRDRMILEINDPSSIKRGFVFNDPELNKIELTFSERPMTLNIIIDGFHSISNQTHPYRQYRSNTAVMWMLFTFALIVALFFLYKYSSVLSWVLADIVINFLSVVVYLNAALLIPRNYVWPFFLAFGWYCLFTLIVLAGVFLDPNIMTIGLLVGRLLFLYLLIRQFPQAVRVLKYKRHTNKANIGTLDEF